MNIKKLSLALLIATGSLAGCGKFLDQIPDNTLTVEDIFKSKAYVDQYLYQVYANMPNEMGQRFVGTNYSGPWIAAADEAMYNWDFNYSNNLNASTWNTTDGTVSTYWTNYYKSIRNASDFIANIDGATSEVTALMKTRYKGEARALRAMYYFWLVRMYGPVPLIPNVIAPDASMDDIIKARTPMDECISYIVTQLDSAYNELDVTPLNNEYGRITKGITKAFKEKALLLAASPLFNGNTDLSSLKNGDGTQLVNQSFDANKWKLAADAAKAFIDEFVPTTYKLYIDPTVTTDTFKLGYLSCRNVMIKVWNEEWIFGRTLSSSNGSDNSQYDKRPKHVGFTTDVQGGGALGATQTIVDAYFMKNGLPITDPASGYVSTAGYTSYQAPFDVQARSTYNQWINREPRFYVGITYNNSYWLYQTTNTSQVITKMEFSGNSGRTQSTSDVSPTGYIVRKGENTANAGLTAGVQIRLADIYLDYAEALNEYDPGNSDILKYVNLIRQRAGIAQYGDLEGQIPLSNTQSAVRDAIRRERQIELAFENHRYFDCHRWKTAMTTDNAPVYGMNMYANGDAFYVRTLIKARIFQQRDYFWPIPNDEVLKNELMVQNPGW